MSDEKKIFLSYSHKNMSLASEIDSALYIRGITVTRDIRDVKCSQSFKEFMRSVGSHDIVLMLISDYYLKSQACMFEVIETMKESDYKERITTIVNDDVCFDLKGITYLKYWEGKRQLIEEAIKGHSREEIKPLIEEMDEIILIKNNIMEFIATISDLKYIPFKELNKQYKELYEAVGLEADKVSANYNTVDERDVGFGFIRRHSTNVLINIDYPKCEIKEALKEVIFSLKLNNDVIWIYAYNKLDDIVTANWFCTGYWVSPNLDQRWRPAEMRSNDQIEDIKITWNHEYESRREAYKPYSGSKNELLKFTDSLLKQVVPIAETAIEKFNQFQNGEIDEYEFLEHMHKERPIESELYSQSLRGNFATYECKDYTQEFDNLFAIVDDMFLYYSIEHMDKWSSENKRIMMSLDKDRFYKKMSELQYERRKLK
ncbi:MAG: toll/interleukin-1 receptor domain-containing protein [Methanosarcina barkeri]|nr:toll/interleukin-1 receptor domain-containing protein [Methanosarcina sp. ERenArc_MAG2]